MSEKAPTTSSAELDEKATTEHSPEELLDIEQAAAGAETVLENALQNSEPSRQVTETERGIKGVVNASIPGGNLEATFNGVGKDAELEEIDINLQEGEETHGIAVKHMDMPPPEILLDGEPVSPEDVPAIQAVIEHIQQEQDDLQEGDNDNEADNSAAVEGALHQSTAEAVTNQFDSISQQLNAVGVQLESIQGSLENIGEKLGKFFALLIELFMVLEEKLNEIEAEEDDEQKEKMKEELQDIVDDYAAKMGQLASGA